MSEQAGRPREIAALAADKIVDLDVRPILRAGGEPFGAIMKAIGDAASEGALKLRATFKPAPLFRVLGSQGWQHWIERGEGDDWIVWFYRAGQNSAPAEVSTADMGAAFLLRDRPELQGRLKVEGASWQLDVRELSPPEPMELTLAVLEKLPKDAALLQLNERVPQFLLPVLLERGFQYTLVGQDSKQVRIEIRHASR